VLLLAITATAMAACGGQPYPVFAVQVAEAPPASAAADAAALSASPPAMALTSASQPVAGTAASAEGLRPRHPQWDLNQATAEQLRQLPGVSAAQVAALIAGRPYVSKRQLVSRHLLTAAEYARWKEYLVVHREAHRGARGAKPGRASGAVPASRPTKPLTGRTN